MKYLLLAILVTACSVDPTPIEGVKVTPDAGTTYEPTYNQIPDPVCATDFVISTVVDGGVTQLTFVIPCDSKYQAPYMTETPGWDPNTKVNTGITSKVQLTGVQ